MTREDQNSGTFNKGLESGLGFFEEFGVDRADAFVQQQYLGVDAGDHAHRQSHPHAGGVRAKGH